MQEWKPNALESKIIEHLLDPNHLKRGSVKKFCEANDLKYSEYYKIKSRPDLNAYLSKLADDLMHGSLLEITASLVRSAKGGSSAQQKLYFEMMNKYVQKIEINTAAKEVEEMSTEDLEKALMEIEED